MSFSISETSVRVLVVAGQNGRFSRYATPQSDETSAYVGTFVLIKSPSIISDRSPRAARFGGTMFRNSRKGVVVAERECFLSYLTTSGGGWTSFGNSFRTYDSDISSNSF